MALSEYLLKSKIGKIFAHKNYKEKMKKKKKMIEMDMNTYHLELIFIFLDII